MKKLNYLLFTGFYLIPMRVLASRGTPAELTKPVGGDILPGGQTFQGDIETSIIFSKILPFAIQWAINLAIALAVVSLVIAGYQFMTAYGDTEKRQKAQKTATFAILGLILAITAFAIVRVVTNINLT